MATFWKETYDPQKHKNRMWGPGCDFLGNRDLKICPHLVYFIRVCSFTFEFHSIEQISTCLQYYSQKLHPSSIIPSKLLETGTCGGDHSETQRWYERLPMKLLENSKRAKVVKAFEKALVEFAELRD